MLSLAGRRHRVESLAFSHCGRWLAAGGRGGVHVWNLTAPADPPVGPPDPGPFATGLAFRPDGRLFFRHHLVADLFDPATGAVTPAAQMSGWHEPAVPSPDGRWLVDIDGRQPRDLRGSALAPTGPAVQVWTVAMPQTWVLGVAFAADSSRFAVATLRFAGGGPGLAVRAADTGGILEELPPAYRQVDQLLYSPDGSKLVARSGRGLAVYDLHAPKAKPRKVANPDQTHFRAAAFHPSGRQLATISNDRVVRVWDTAAWTAASSFEWNVGKLYAVAYSPDGATCAVGSHTGRVLVWDADA